MADNHVIQILVVDDDRSIRETLRVVLQDEGYSVLEAEDGKAALRILQASSQPMVVLLDLRMPVLDGAGVLAYIAAHPSLAGLHAFLLITANRDSIAENTAQLLQQLQVPIIPKPFDLDALIEIVEQTMCRVAGSTPPDSWQATRSTTS